jgi:hypothetical protein
MKAAPPTAAGELQITRALRLELHGTGVRVCTLDPGLAETEFSLVRFQGDADRARQVYRGTIPLTAEDVAEAMVWMATRPAACLHRRNDHQADRPGRHPQFVIDTEPRYTYIPLVLQSYFARISYSQATV